VAADSGTIVEQSEQGCDLQLAAGGHDFAFGFVEVAVPEGVNVTHLIRASLARNEARILLVAAEFSVFSEAMVLHEPADGGVARQHAELGFQSPDGSQIVVHELVAPARVLSAQRADLSLDDRVMLGCVPA